MTHTVRIGTRMAPSPGGAHRLMTVPTSRWFIAIMMLRRARRSHPDSRPDPKAARLTLPRR